MKISEAAGLQVVQKRDEETWARLDRKAEKRAKGPSGESIIIAEGKPFTDKEFPPQSSSLLAPPGT